jgi:hypothetical protein
MALTRENGVKRLCWIAAGRGSSVNFKLNVYLLFIEADLRF